MLPIWAMLNGRSIDGFRVDRTISKCVCSRGSIPSNGLIIKKGELFREYPMVLLGSRFVKFFLFAFEVMRHRNTNT